MFLGYGTTIPKIVPAIAPRSTVVPMSNIVKKEDAARRRRSDKQYVWIKTLGTKMPVMGRLMTQMTTTAKSKEPHGRQIAHAWTRTRIAFHVNKYGIRTVRVFKNRVRQKDKDCVSELSEFLKFNPNPT